MKRIKKTLLRKSKKKIIPMCNDFGLHCASYFEKKDVLIRQIDKLYYSLNV